MMHRLLLAAAMLSFTAPAIAQDEAEPVAIDIQKPDIAPVEPFPQGYRSLFFMPDEHARVMGAFSRHMPGAAAPAAPATPTSAAPLPTARDGEMAPRILHLSGIVYANPQDWSIWLNGKQITPTSQPDEVRGLRVLRDYIELQWYDVETKAVVPVRLRPQQRFHLDTHSFLPGVGEPVPAIPPSLPAAAAPEENAPPPTAEPVIEEPEEEWDDWEEDEAMLWELLESDLP